MSIPGESELTVRKKKQIDTTPFDRYKMPPKQNLFLMPAIWGICFFLTRSGRLKITKTNMEGIKPPFIVYGSHHAFMDFYVTPLALFPWRANYVSELEGFEYFGEGIYRQVGCLGTRKFINDMALVKNIKKLLEKGIVVIYPEARYANVGTSTELPESVGKLAKIMKVPVVGINMHGNYLQSPIWNLSKRKHVPLEAELKGLLTREQVLKLSASQIREEVSDFLSYDEYKWQFNKKIRIDESFRAEGLHKALYKCENCSCDFTMRSKGDELFCEKCGTRYFMTEYGRLLKDGKEFGFSHIPDWYEWERRKVEEEIDDGSYLLDMEVEVHGLPNSKNFINCGKGRLVQDKNGFLLTFKDYGKDSPSTLQYPPLSCFSIHTEYDYRGKSECVTLSTNDNTYFLFPLEEGFNPTKIQFATEYINKLGRINKS